jgi:hypothetical protein
MVGKVFLIPVALSSQKESSLSFTEKVKGDAE